MASSESIYSSSEARKNSVVHNHVHKDSFNTVTLKKSSHRKGKVNTKQDFLLLPFLLLYLLVRQVKSIGTKIEILIRIVTTVEVLDK